MTKNKLLLPSLLLLASCTMTSLLDESAQYTRLGEHSRAFSLLDEERNRQLAAGGKVDPRLEAAHTEARKMFLLDSGRQNIFMEREDQALVDLAALLAMDPDNETAKALQERAIEKKAAKATAAGLESLFKNDLEEALGHFMTAESVLPGYPPAIEGSERVREAVGKLKDRAQQQFLDAVRKLPEFRFVEVRWHAANSMGNDPTRNDADNIRLRANAELARAAFVRGVENRKLDRFGAALIDFKAAQRLDPSLDGINEAIAGMENELRASNLAERASMWIRSGKFEQANASLREAYELSQIARAGISELMMESRRREADSKYQDARNLEILSKKQEALAAFESLVQFYPEGLSDEVARIDALQTDIAGAVAEWQAAEAAEAEGDLSKALQHYRTADRYYPGYRDVKERMERLRAALTPPPGGEPNGG